MSKFFILIFYFILYLLSYSNPTLKFGLTIPKGSIDAAKTEKLVTTIFSKLNYNCSFQYFPVERCTQMLLAEKIDGLPGKPVEELVNFPNIPVVKESFLEIPFNVYYKNKTLKTLSWSELEKYKCVNIIGVKFVNQKMPNATQKGNLYDVATYKQALKMVEVERVDFAILIEPIADNIIKKEKIVNIKKINKTLSSTSIYILLSKKHINLAPKASEVLKQMKKDGSYYKILDEFK